MPAPNVLFISLDTVRGDVALSGKMPVIESLRRRGTTFTQAISSCPLTPVSHATVFTGLQPPGHGVRHLLREQLRPDVPTLAEIARSAGYETGAVVSCPGLNKWYGMDRGFDFYDDKIPLLADGRDPLTVGDVKMRGTALKRAPEVMSLSSEWLASRDGSPFFFFAHFFDAHWPYEPPEDVGVDVSNAYEGEVAYADHYLGLLLQAMTEAGHDLSSMLIVCFSDHGEDLAGWYPNDHAGDLGYPYEEGHGCLLFDATQHVPLIFSGPGIPVGHEVGHQVRLVDIMPTVLDLLGLKQPRSDGESLTAFFGPGKGATSRPAYSETYFPEERQGYPGLHPLRSLRFGSDERKEKFIWEVESGKVDYYSLSTDPNELHGQALAIEHVSDS